MLSYLRTVPGKSLGSTPVIRCFKIEMAVALKTRHGLIPHEGISSGSLVREAAGREAHASHGATSVLSPPYAGASPQWLSTGLGRV